MSQWHRDNPDLAGTEQDPWMRHEPHARAAREVTAMRCPATMEDVEESGLPCPCGQPAFSHRRAEP